GLKRYGLKSFFKNVFSITASDAVVVSFQKSGRTWLRLMFGKILEEQYKIKKVRLDTEYMTLFSSLPNVLFSHGGCTKNNNTLDFRKVFKNKKVVVLARDPRAVMVSLFYDHTTRNLLYEGDNISEFIRDENWGLPKVMKFMNSWGEELKQRENVLLIRYEDLYTDTKKELKRFLEFLGLTATEEVLDHAVEYGSVRNMRKMELKNEFKDKRMLPGDVKNQNSYRTRNCKLGSFKEELKKEDLEYITKVIKEQLHPIFNYT
ncbi:MAG: sulfotransferase domain-containing protein, partial [Nanoarchaeota archaeon]